MRRVVVVVGAILLPSFISTWNVLPLVVVVCHYGSFILASTSLPSTMFSSRVADIDHRRPRVVKEKDGHSITVSLSTWHPNTTLDVTEMEGPILRALQLLFCNENGWIVVDDKYSTACVRSLSGTSNSARSNHNGNDSNPSGNSTSSSSSEGFIEELLSEVDPANSYLFSIPIGISVSDDDDGGINWAVWRVTYEVIQIGDIFLEQAKMMNVSVPVTYMEDVTQLALDVSIMEGVMDRRLDGAGIVTSTVGMELQTFEAEIVSEVQNETDDYDHDYDDEDDNDDGTSTAIEPDFYEIAIILRYVGVIMLLINATIIVLLTYVARRRRLAAEQKVRKAELELEESKGLVTEQGVNLMLDIGRKASEKLLSQYSSSRLVTDQSGIATSTSTSSSSGVKSPNPEKRNTEGKESVRGQ
jgi:hypothetical protein